MINWIINNFKTFLDLTIGKFLHKKMTPIQTKKSKIRSYKIEVEDFIFKNNKFNINIIGEVSMYKIYALEKIINPMLPTLLITGGVHGSEPAGVFTIIKNLEWLSSLSNINIILVPCVNPFGFEHNTRVNSNGEDINRNFINESKCLESNLVMNYLKKMKITHSLDLHETAEEDLINAGLVRFFDKKEHISDGIFIYQSHKNNSKLFGEEIILELENKNYKVCSMPSIWEEPCIKGTITYPEARVSPLFSAKGSLEDYCVDNLCDISMTMETMAYEDMDKRIAAMTIAIKKTITILLK